MNEKRLKMNSLFEVYIFFKYIFNVHMLLLFRLITDTYLTAEPVLRLNMQSHGFKYWLSRWGEYLN
jgi:hypothetical protein